MDIIDKENTPILHQVEQYGEIGFYLRDGQQESSSAGFDLRACHLLQLTDKSSVPPWGIFDYDWYKTQYKPLIEEFFNDRSEALDFYLKNAGTLEHSPNIFFDERWHRVRYPAVASAVQNGAVESSFDAYCRGGSTTQSPHWLFDEEFYCRRYPSLADNLARTGFVNGYDHFLRFGCQENRIGHRFFDPRIYVAQLSSDEAEVALIDGPYIHYLRRLNSKLNQNQLRTALIFDPQWYVQRYPSVLDEIASGIYLSALHHYLTNPSPRDFDPLPQFSEEYYAASNPGLMAVVQSGEWRNGYDHFLAHGAHELRNPHPTIDMVQFISDNQHFEKARATDRFLTPFEYYLEIRTDDIPSPYPAVLSHRSTIATRDDDTNTEDYEVAVLRAEFDELYYTQTYPDIIANGLDPFDHFRAFGWKEGRNPSAWFSTSLYLQRYDDVRAKGVNPFLHYLTEGREQGREAFSTNDEDPIARDMRLIKTEFDHEYYIQRYPDLVSAGVNTLEHFCLHGWKEGRNPAAWFSTQLYKNFYTQVEGNPFVHYVTNGRMKGFQIWPADHTGPRELTVDHDANLVSDVGLLDLIRYEPRPLRPNNKPIDPQRLNIHFVIPDFSIGSGGHMTIFRIVRWLEFAGHSCTLWIWNPVQHRRIDHARSDIILHFQTIKAGIRFLDESFENASGDVIFATGWQTVSAICHQTDFRARFYLVQDLEPSFYSVGSHSLAADMSYRVHDLSCVCASPWLAQVMHGQYGRWARFFWLAYDANVYKPAVDIDMTKGPPRIAVYGRISTSRRAVELALLALELLANQGVQFHADLYGSELDFVRASFPATVHGILGAEKLAELYQKATIGICFSATNYSLVPQEMMACGLPVVELDTASTRAIFPGEVVTFAGPHPRDIALAVRSLLSDSDLRGKQRKAAYEWIRDFSWEASAGNVENAIFEKLKEIYPTLITSDYKSELNNTNRRPIVKASICIPTYNGGDLLRSVVESVLKQRVPSSWDFEVIVVDSSSSDGSCQFLEYQDRIIFKKIKQSEFGHGRTRNYCASLGTGEFILFLTQDALPKDEFWLYNMVTAMEQFPEAGGAFGRHEAWPDATIFTKRDLKNHFAGFEGFPVLMSRDTDRLRWESGDTGWRQVLHFFSDNNSCLRRSVWNDIPYPDIEFGEDQVWANRIVEAGFGRLYVPNAVVYHSHDYSADETAERAATEARFFLREFGYKTYNDEKSFDEQLQSINAEDRVWAKLNNVPTADLLRRLDENEAKLRGTRIGSKFLTDALM